MAAKAKTSTSGSLDSLDYAIETSTSDGIYIRRNGPLPAGRLTRAHFCLKDRDPKIRILIDVDIVDGEEGTRAIVSNDRTNSSHRLFDELKKIGINLDADVKFGLLADLNQKLTDRLVLVK